MQTIGSNDETLAIGVDLGGTKIAAALVRRDGQVLASRHVPTGVADGTGAVLNRVAEEIRRLLDETRGKVLGIGIGLPGMIDRATGVVRNAVNLRWDEVHLVRELRERLSTAVDLVVENDANANAVGERLFGSARGSADFVLLTVGSGLGGAAVSGGRLLTGAHGMANDLGHLPLDPIHGRACACGNRGCAETIVSGPGLLAVMRSVLAERSHPTRLNDDASLTTGAIVAAAREHDRGANEAVGILARHLGQLAAMASVVLDPDLIVIGGGLGVAAADLLLPHVQHELDRRLPLGQPRPAVRAATLASPAIGAASLVWSIGTE